MQACIIVQYPCLLHASCERLDLLRTESSSRMTLSIELIDSERRVDAMVLDVMKRLTIVQLA
jgi:hypothetical protein